VHIPAKPQPGMVICYAYLWKHEQEKGQTEGRKDRPAAIVLTRTDLGPGEMVYVLPITHRKPAEGDPWRILIPWAIKQRLGLDAEKSWVDVTEFNVFVWSGYHVRPTKRPKTSDQETYLYGYLPSRFFNTIRKTLDAYRRSHKPGIVRR
jgi:hypothetical protein